MLRTNEFISRVDTIFEAKNEIGVNTTNNFKVNCIASFCTQEKLNSNNFLEISEKSGFT